MADLRGVVWLRSGEVAAGLNIGVMAAQEEEQLGQSGVFQLAICA